MPVRGYYRVRTGKRSGVILSTKSKNMKGCTSAAYWVLFGWWFFLTKWFFIWSYKFLIWSFKLFMKSIQKLSFWVDKLLKERGHNFGQSKVKAALLIFFSIFFFSLCAISGAFNESITPAAPSPINATNTLDPLHIPVIFQTPITPTPTLDVFARSESACVPKNTKVETALVTRIVDGDTIEVEKDGQLFSLRYIGIDSPEPGEDNADTATRINTDLVLNQTVTLVKDVSETDSFGRLLRYVFVGTKLVNYELIKAGYATSGTWKPDIACNETFHTAEQVAKVNAVGMWPKTPTPAPTIMVIATNVPQQQSNIIPFVPLVPIVPIVPTQAPSGNCSPAYPTVCIPPAPPDLDCGQIPYRSFQVLPPDPHNFDGDHDGIGCEG